MRRCKIGRGCSSTMRAHARPLWWHAACLAGVRNGYPTGGGPAGIHTIDALVEEITGEAESAVAPERRPPLTGERRLAAELIDTAMQDAMRAPRGPRDNRREDARLWLRDALAPMSARYCFEQLGLDYDAALAKLEAKWKQQP